MDRERLTVYMLIATSLMKRDRLRRAQLAEPAMGIFGEPPRHIDRLKRNVKERDEQHEVKITRAFIDYDDRLTQAERAVVGQLDQHAMAQEAALSELTNRGEGVAAEVTSNAGGSLSAEVPAEVDAGFPKAAE